MSAATTNVGERRWNDVAAPQNSNRRKKKSIFCLFNTQKKYPPSQPTATQPKEQRALVERRINMADEQETKVPDTVSVEVGKKEEGEVVSVVTEAAAAVPKEEEDGEEPKTKEEGGEEAVKAAKSTATFEPVVSSIDI